MRAHASIAASISFVLLAGLLAACDGIDLDALGAAGTCVEAARAPGARARAADDFVDAFGLRLETGALDREVLRQRTAELGPRHLRARDPEALVELARPIGARILVISEGTADPLPVVRRLGALAGGVGFYDTTDPATPGWGAALLRRQTELFRAMKATEETRAIPVLGPTLESDERIAAAGDLSAVVDYGTMSPWRPAWRTRPPGERAAEDLARHRSAFGPRPFVVPQVGYSTHAGPDGVSEAIQDKYLPRMLLEHYRIGVHRTYVAELVDLRGAPGSWGTGFGLLRADGTPKPAFVTTQRLLALLRDPGPSFSPGALAHAIDGAPPELRSLLLQRRNGVFFLALWLEIVGGDAPLTRAVTLRFTPAAASAVVYRPAASLAPTRRDERVTALPLEVDDGVTLVEIRSGCP